MHTKRLIMLLLVFLYPAFLFAQDKANEQKADATSLQLYNEKKWTELLEYGKATLAQGTDFPLLRMRTGYAAFIIGNFSESLKQYEMVYNNDHENSIALYYVYLNNVYLNNITAARRHASLLSEETRSVEKLEKYKVSQVNMEYSYKMPDLVDRGNAQYGRLGLNLQLGYRLELQQGVAFYNQVISEPALTGVTNNRNIDIAQREYYAKLIFAAKGNLAVIGGIHYLYTPFNNFIYNNFVGFGGVKYTAPFIHVQAMINLGNIRDTAYQQFDVALTTYPLGSTKLYTISKVAYGNEFTFTQVAGVKILNGIWLEGNVTAGQYKILLANDALYVFDDIDTKKFKVGASIHAQIAKKLTLTANYNYEQKQRYGTSSVYFNQHSTTGGLLWNF